MSTTYGNANYRKKFDAFRIIDQSGWEPLKEAISCALRLREASETFKKALSGKIKAEARVIASQGLSRATVDEFNAWIKVAEFIYSKPKHVEISGHLTYEQFLDGTWKDMITNGSGQG